MAVAPLSLCAQFTRDFDQALQTTPLDVRKQPIVEYRAFGEGTDLWCRMDVTELVKHLPVNPPPTHCIWFAVKRKVGGLASGESWACGVRIGVDVPGLQDTSLPLCDVKMEEWRGVAPLLRAKWFQQQPDWEKARYLVVLSAPEMISARFVSLQQALLNTYQRKCSEEKPEGIVQFFQRHPDFARAFLAPFGVQGDVGGEEFVVALEARVRETLPKQLLNGLNRTPEEVIATGIEHHYTELFSLFLVREWAKGKPDLDFTLPDQVVVKRTPQGALFIGKGDARSDMGLQVLAGILLFRDHAASIQVLTPTETTLAHRVIDSVRVQRAPVLGR